MLSAASVTPASRSPATWERRSGTIPRSTAQPSAAQVARVITPGPAVRTAAPGPAPRTEPAPRRRSRQLDHGVADRHSPADRGQLGSDGQDVPGGRDDADNQERLQLETAAFQPA